MTAGVRLAPPLLRFTCQTARALTRHFRIHPGVIHRPLQSRRGAAPLFFLVPHMSEGAERRLAHVSVGTLRGCRGPLRSARSPSGAPLVAIYRDPLARDSTGRCGTNPSLKPRCLGPSPDRALPQKAAPSSGTDNGIAPWDVATGHACRRHIPLRQPNVSGRRPQ